MSGDAKEMGAAAVYLFFLALAVSVLSQAQAKDYPTRPITLIVPAGAGGSPDIVARLIAQPLSRILGRPIVVENLPGAAGIIGTERVTRAQSDGYTLLYGYNQLATMNPAVYPKLSYLPERDLAPIGVTLKLSYMWIATPKLGVRQCLN